jgi:hypothetical protein
VRLTLKPTFVSRKPNKLGHHGDTIAEQVRVKLAQVFGNISSGNPVRLKKFSAKRGENNPRARGFCLRQTGATHEKSVGRLCLLRAIASGKITKECLLVLASGGFL